MNIKRIISETVNLLLENVEPIFHFTPIRKLESILKTNKINLSTHLGSGADNKNSKGFYFLSLSRSGSPLVGYGRNTAGIFNDANEANNFARITFDKRKLRANLKASSVDYWQRKDIEVLKKLGQRPEDIMNRMMRDFEYEDRVFSSKPNIENINKYIERIDIFTNKEADFEVRDILIHARNLGLGVYVYNDMNAFIKGDKSKAVNSNHENAPDPEEPPYRRNSRLDTGFLQSVLAIIFYDPKLIESYDNATLRPMVEDLLKRYNIQLEVDDTFLYKTFDAMRYYQWAYPGSAGLSDSVNSLSATIHNMGKDGSDDPNRATMHMLSDAMSKINGVKDLQDLFLVKVSGMRPKGLPKVKFSKLYSFEINGSIIPNDIMIRSEYNLSIFNLKNELSKRENDILWGLHNDKKTMGDLIDFLMNSYIEPKLSKLVSVLTNNNGKIVKGVQNNNSGESEF